MADANQAEIDALERERARLTAGPTDNVTSVPFTPGAGADAAELDALEREHARLTMQVSPLSGLVPATSPAATPGAVQLSGEAPPDAEPNLGMWPEALTPQRFSANRRPDLEDLPDLISAPAIRSRAGATAMFTAAGADEVEKIIKSNNPGTEVETTPEGYKVYKFPGDKQKYAWKPGIRGSDIARALPGAGMALGASLAAPAAMASTPFAMAGSAVSAVLGELLQKHYGGDINPAQIALATLAPAIIPAGRTIAGKVAQLGGAIAAPVGQTAESLAPRVTDRAGQLLQSWGADPDASALGQRLANITQPAVDQADAAATSAAANTETATAAATAKAEAGTAAAQTQAETGAASAAAKADADTLAAQTRAEDAAAAAGTQARGASTAARIRAQDAVAGAAARADQAALAANAPVAAVYDQAGQALKKWGAIDSSYLDRKLMDRVRGFLDESKNRATALFGRIEKGMPKGAPVASRPELDAALEWISGELEGQDPRIQSPMLKKAQLLLTPELVEDATVPPQIGTVTELRKQASKAGFKGDFATENSGTGKKLAELLTDVEYSVAKDHGMDGLVADARAEVAGRKAFEGKLKEALTIKGARALNATVVPLMDATGNAMQKGNTEPLRRLMAITPKGMEKEVMATTVQRAMLDSAPTDPAKAAQHIADFVNNLKANKVVGHRVLGMLPEEAKQGILSIGADAEAALARRNAALAAAETEKAAAVQAAGRTKTAELGAIQQDKAAAGLMTRREKAAALAAIDRDKEAVMAAVGRQKADALTAVGTEKANTIAAAKGAEGAAKGALAAAQASNIPLVPTMRAAGNALLNGDLKPLNGMVATVGGRIPRHKLVASTLYHTLIDPTKEGASGLTSLANGLTALEANPVARDRILSLLSREASGPGGLEDLTWVSKTVHSGTAAGAQNAEGFLGRLASMGAWATGKSGFLLGGAIGSAVGGPVGGAAGSAGGFLAGRMLNSALSVGRSAATKAANAALMTDVGKELLQRLSLNLPVEQNLLQRVGQNGAFRWFLQKAGVPRGNMGRVLDQLVNSGTKQALTTNRREE